MTNPRSIDQMLALFDGDTATKTASAPVVDAPVSAPAATPTPAPSTPSIEAAAQKIASAEDAQMRTTAAAFGAEFGKAAAAELEKSPVFAKTASAPGAAVDINQAAVDAAFRAGMLKGASDMVDTWRSAYAKNLQAEHDMLTVVHLSGQAHGAALRKHASDVVEKQKLVDGGQLKQADAEVTLPASLPFVSAPTGA